MSKELERLWSHLDEQRVLSLSERAVRAYSPSGKEGPSSSIFEQALAEAKVPYTKQPVGREGRYNLIARLGPDPVELMLVGHVDTIRLLPTEELQVSRDEDTLHGLGAADMKGGCAAIVECMAALASSRFPLSRGVLAALVVGEEEYGDGTVALKDEHKAPLTVIGEPTGLSPCTEHHGYLELELYALGRRAHAALPEEGANAIEPMLRWLLGVIERSHELGDGVVVNVRELEGGSELFVVPDRCEACLDVHLPVGVPPEAMERIVDEVRASIAKGRVELAYKRLCWGPGYALEEDPPHLDVLKRAFKDAELPFEPRVFRSHSDASHLKADDDDDARASHPVVCGPGRLEVAHARHEHVALSEIWQAARLYTAIAYEACRPPDRR